MKTYDIHTNNFISKSYSNATVYDYFLLMKPRVMSLVIFTGFVGIFLAPLKPHPILSFISLLAIALGAGGSAAINMWYERDIDLIMSRTRYRPIPSGKIHPSEALSFGVILSLFSVILLSFSSNFLAGGLLIFTIFFYGVIYTIFLKRSTSQNIVIGGAAGSLPPVIGWVSSTNSISIEPLILFAIIFLWTPPHFWSLALVSKDDYKLAKIPMLPVISSIKETNFQILVYTIILIPFAISPYFIGMATFIFGLGSMFFGALFLFFILRLCFKRTNSSAISAFKMSIIYLFSIFSLLILDRILIDFI